MPARCGICSRICQPLVPVVGEDQRLVLPACRSCCRSTRHGLTSLLRQMRANRYNLEQVAAGPVALHVVGAHRVHRPSRQYLYAGEQRSKTVSRRRDVPPQDRPLDPDPQRLDHGGRHRLGGSAQRATSSRSARRTDTRWQSWRSTVGLQGSEQGGSAGPRGPGKPRRTRARRRSPGTPGAAAAYFGRTDPPPPRAARGRRRTPQPPLELAPAAVQPGHHGPDRGAHDVGDIPCRRSPRRRPAAPPCGTARAGRRAPGEPPPRGCWSSSSSSGVSAPVVLGLALAIRW